MAAKKTKAEKTAVAHGKSAEKEDNVTVHYTGKLNDGTVFGSSEGKDPLKFVLGQGMVIPGFDEAIIGMRVGDEKDIIVEPEKGYGIRNDELVQEVPLSQLKEKEKFQPGMMLTLQDPQGRVVQAYVVSINNDTMTLDLNHPLAGQTLNFRIRLEGLE